MFHFSKSSCFVLAGLTLALVGGCAGAKVDPTMTSKSALPRPDRIIVNNFAVTPSEVKLDRGMLATAMRDDKDRMPNEEEAKVGHYVAERLSATLVEELTDRGIVAVRGGPNVTPTTTTVVLNGQFMTIDQGNQSKRVWIGFGMGGSELRTRIQAIQGGELVAQADTATKSSLKPGLVTSAGGTGASVAVGAVSTGFSEAFMATVEADAKRTAKEVAKKIEQGYVNRGWIEK
jgi:hypothetical protein